jgi:hypothetical protein
MNKDHGPDPGRAHELWSLREDVDVELKLAGGPVRLKSPWGEITIPQPSRPVREALHRMSLGPVSLENISGVARNEHPGQRRQLFRVLDRLQAVIIRSVKRATGEPLLSVVPLTPQSVFHPAPLSPDVPVRLSSFAELRTDGREYRLESPLAMHRVLLHRAEAVHLIGMLAGPCTPVDAMAALTESEPAAMAALEYLIASGIVTQVKAPPDAEDPPDPTTPIFDEESELALAGWSPADLMFHASSTLGCHDHYCGVT